MKVMGSGHHFHLVSLSRKKHFLPDHHRLAKRTCKHKANMALGNPIASVTGRPLREPKVIETEIFQDGFLATFSNVFR